MLIVIGLYSVLWGKHKEGIENKAEEIPEAIKGPQVNRNNNMIGISAMDDIEANNQAHDDDDDRLKKEQVHNLSSKA